MRRHVRLWRFLVNFQELGLLFRKAEVSVLTSGYCPRAAAIAAANASARAKLSGDSPSGFSLLSPQNLAEQALCHV